MTLDEFWVGMNKANEKRQQGKQLVAEAQAMEDRVIREAGIQHHSREPGFPCWTSEGVGYYNSPWEALGAKLALSQ